MSKVGPSFNQVLELKPPWKIDKIYLDEKDRIIQVYFFSGGVNFIAQAARKL